MELVRPQPIHLSFWSQDSFREYAKLYIDNAGKKNPRGEVR